jgi:hypothetical protein
VSSLDRRSLLRGGAAAVALTALPASGAAPAAVFDPPSTPMLYARRLERGLPGGARLAVSRRFAVRFARHDEGFRVDGDQLGVEVEAPETLAEFARIERERREAGLFPLSLDATGTIRGVAPGIDNARLDDAVRAAVARIEAGDHPQAERERLRGFVEAVHRSAGAILTELPRDLFAPVDCPRTERRAVALPGGDPGEVRLSFDAVRDSATGVMREARREVVTEIAGDLRRSVESWTLAPLA